MDTTSRSGPATYLVRPAGRAIRLTAWIVALGTAAFAVPNVVFEITGRFVDSPIADYSRGISVVNWFVASLKVMGAAVALLSTASKPRMSARVLNTLVWAEVGVLGVYSLGNVAQLVGMATGLAGSPDQIDPAGVAYVALFLLAAAGFAAVAMSHTRRSGLGPAPAIVGSIGGLILLGVILWALPMLLAAMGIIPSS